MGDGGKFHIFKAKEGIFEIILAINLRNPIKYVCNCADFGAQFRILSCRQVPGGNKMSTQIHWAKCRNDEWCKLNSVDLQHECLNGVEGAYVIWHYPNRNLLNASQLGMAKAVYVGQGNIRERLSVHHLDDRIQSVEPGPLYVTWAEVDAGKRDGVEAYLGDKLRPLFGERFPDVTPIPVNRPNMNNYVVGEGLLRGLKTT